MPGKTVPFMETQKSKIINHVLHNGSQDLKMTSCHATCTPCILDNHLPQFPFPCKAFTALPWLNIFDSPQAPSDHEDLIHGEPALKSEGHATGQEVDLVSTKAAFRFGLSCHIECVSDSADILYCVQVGRHFNPMQSHD